MKYDLWYVKKNRLWKQKGFTLIEIMVTVGIILLMLGFGIVYVNSFASRQEIKSVREEVVTDLRLARNYALTNQLPESLWDPDLPNKELKYVKVFSVGNSLSVTGVTIDNEEGTYFTKALPVGLLFEEDKTLYFSIYKGKIINENGIPLPVGTTVSFSITSGKPGAIPMPAIVMDSGLIK